MGQPANHAKVLLLSILKLSLFTIHTELILFLIHKSIKELLTIFVQQVIVLKTLVDEKATRLNSLGDEVIGVLDLHWWILTVKIAIR